MSETEESIDLNTVIDGTVNCEVENVGTMTVGLRRQQLWEAVAMVCSILRGVSILLSGDQQAQISEFLEVVELKPPRLSVRITPAGRRLFLHE